MIQQIPSTPSLNLDAALTGVSVNGVTLTDAGLATNFLNEEGNYVAIPPSGGQVDSVQSGVNVTVDASDPVNPIVNLDAAITGVSVNGVTLSAAGLATNFLNEEGNYVAIPGGGGLVDTVQSGTNITVDSADPVNPIVNLDPVIDLSGTTNTPHITLENSPGTAAAILLNNMGSVNYTIISVNESDAFPDEFRLLADIDGSRP